MSHICVVAGCGRRHYGRGYCRTHHSRWSVHGDPQAERPIEHKIEGGVSYWSTRQRLRTVRGPASARACAECGAPATDWSYVGGDPAERVCRYRGYHYSLDLDRYRPRCRSCHRRATVALAAPSPHRAQSFDVDQDQVVRLYEAGEPEVNIAVLLGVSRDAVYQVLRDRRVSTDGGGDR